MAPATSKSATAHSEPVLTSLKVCRTWVAVGLAVLLPGLYAIYWQFRVAAELRAFGRNREDRRLSTISSGLLAMTVGWILVFPALIQLVRTARDVQRAEELKFERARSVNTLLRVIVTCVLVALMATAALNAAVLAPIAILVAAIAEIVVLQPRLNALWRDEGPSLPFGRAPVRPDSLPVVPPRLRAWAKRRWSSYRTWQKVGIQCVGWLLGAILAILMIYAAVLLGRLLIAEDRTGTFDGVVTTAAVIWTGVWISFGVGWALRSVADGRVKQLLATRDQIDRDQIAIAGLGLALAVVWLWSARPLFHGVLMAFYQWPLATWIPIVLGLVFTATCVPLAVVFRRGAQAGLRAGVTWRMPVTVVLWLVFVIQLPGWQGYALYESTMYTVVGDLPYTTQPRLLPKAAAQAYARDSSLHNAHLVIDPASGRLVWSAERTEGFLRRGPSQGFAILPIDRVDGTEQSYDAGFRVAVSRVGPSSLQWQAYNRHFFTRVQDGVIVPLPGGGAVAVAPYVGYRGFPVRHPYWAGVYVLHQDGRLEDLTPRQALARPELVASGRLFPERLARAIAAAYSYRTGSDAAIANRPRTEVSDPSGNPQPYLTNLAAGNVDWVTVAHTSTGPNTLAAVFLTNSSTGATKIWKPPPGEKLLSNTGAATLVRALPLQWTGCCDSEGNNYWQRKVVEPTPVFAKGHLYYLVSVIPNSKYLATAQPVDQTVVVDAEQHTIVEKYDHADPSADARLRAFFNARK
jgi:hypothetical protein